MEVIAYESTADGFALTARSENIRGLCSKWYRYAICLYLLHSAGQSTFWTYLTESRSGKALRP